MAWSGVTFAAKTYSTVTKSGNAHGRFLPVRPFEDADGGVDFQYQIKDPPDFYVTADRPVPLTSTLSTP